MAHPLGTFAAYIAAHPEKENNDPVATAADLSKHYGAEHALFTAAQAVNPLVAIGKLRQAKVLGHAQASSLIAQKVTEAKNGIH